MTGKAPGFRIRIGERRIPAGSADRVLSYLEQALREGLEGYQWTGREGRPGWAMTRLFARLIELVFDRLNQVPDKNFLAFLNAAGVELLPPLCASTELTFTLAEDAPPFIEVPEGTQVATVQTETSPEVVFQTTRDLMVAPNAVAKCIAFDQVHFTDRTVQVTETPAASKAFPVFKGDTERERILFLGDELLSFPDDSSRENARVTLGIGVATPGEPERDGGWGLEWLYWDGSGWKDLPEGCVTDSTDGFQVGDTIEISSLPALEENLEFGKAEGVSLACRLKGGSARNHLPVLNRITISRAIDIGIDDAPVPATADAAFYALKAGVAYVPLDLSGEFYPLGPRPSRLDTFYLLVDEALSKKGATVHLKVDLMGLPDDVKDNSELDKLEITWEYHGKTGWALLGRSKRTGVTDAAFGFDDATRAFTITGEELDISFTVPDIAKTTVNDQEGYWVRARVTAGSYDEPGGMTANSWIPPRTHAPLIRKLGVTFGNYSVSSGDPRPIQRCWSKVDGMGRDHSQVLTAGKPFSPFSAKEEGPALYVGFKRRFPQGKWIQLLLDMDQEAETWKARKQKLYWEYWDGTDWTPLRLSDGTRGLTRRGYVGFFAPEDHAKGTEFGKEAFWLRVRPHRAPVADAGPYTDISAPPGEREAKVVLDAGSSRVKGRGRIVRYLWRSVSTSTLYADAGTDTVVVAEGNEATVSLDASGSASGYGTSVEKYLWRLASQEQPSVDQDAQAQVRGPYLKSIRINTVPAINSITVKDEILGSSNGEPGQDFTLLHSPVLPGLELAVREPDRPPDEELKALMNDLGVHKISKVLVPVSRGEGSQGVWVRWCQVKDFYSSTPASRHFVLDPITGKITFGDGRFGKVPPVGGDNIKALAYRTHNGAQGNVASGTVTVLRNPSGDLQNIKAVTNMERAAGGSDAETLDEVRERGPQSLKHRHRAVTIEDFAWLALEASGEVAQARCLPTRNPVGLPQPGWVTVVITPESLEPRPTPSPALLRRVRAYLEGHALANLKESGQILVKGPEYIQVSVMAKVKASVPEKADEVELAVLKRLEKFLHPLNGGPEGTGWELGRDVFLSEVSAEIESVEGVDYLDGLRLLGTIQQFLLTLDPGDRQVPFDIPLESKVGTFDDKMKLILAMPILRGNMPGIISVYGFRKWDPVRIVGADNTVLKDKLKLASVSMDQVTFDQSFDYSSFSTLPGLAVMSPDGKLRLPIAEDGLSIGAEGLVQAALQGLGAGDAVSIVAGTRRDEALEFIPVQGAESCEDRIFVPEGYLVCSGSHDVDMILE